MKDWKIGIGRFTSFSNRNYCWACAAAIRGEHGYGTRIDEGDVRPTARNHHFIHMGDGRLMETLQHDMSCREGEKSKQIPRTDAANAMPTFSTDDVVFPFQSYDTLPTEFSSPRCLQCLQPRMIYQPPLQNRRDGWLHGNCKRHHRFILLPIPHHTCILDI